MKILKTKSARITTSAVLISSLFAACGGGGGGSPTAAPPPTQAPAATIAATVPADKATKISARQDIVVTFSGPLNESTVIANNVLITGGGVTAPISVSYDPASFKLTIHPQEPLSDGVLYTVAIAGIRDFAGNAIPNSNFTFKTFIIGSPRVTFYDTTGAVAGYTQATVDSNDNIVQITTFSNAAGTEASGYQQIQYDARGNPSRFVDYSTGDDKKANTADDVLVRSRTQSYDDKGNILQVVNLNAAGAVTTFTTNSYNAFGYITQAITASGAGADRLLGTADDDVDTYTNRSYNARNALTREATYRTSATKRIALGSDTPINFSSRDYDAIGNMIQRVDYKDSGPDNVPFNGNDTYSLVHTSRYDQNGNPIQTVFSDGLGATAKVLGYVNFTFGNFGLTLLEAFLGAVGAGTYDHYTKTEYDPVNGNLIARTTYNGPGTNGLWEPRVANPDDRKGEAGNYYGGF